MRDWRWKRRDGGPILLTNIPTHLDPHVLARHCHRHWKAAGHISAPYEYGAMHIGYQMQSHRRVTQGRTTPTQASHLQSSVSMVDTISPTHHTRLVADHRLTASRLSQKS